jgi:hypothetical protein
VQKRGHARIRMRKIYEMTTNALWRVKFGQDVMASVTN